MKTTVLTFEGFESLQDFDRNINEAMEDLDVPGEFEGTIRVTIEYLGDNCDGKQQTGGIPLPPGGLLR